jgi:hypothetical protein
MAVLRSPLDTESTPRSRPRARVEHAVGLAFGERDQLRQQVSALARQVTRLTDELARVRQENLDLREAAALWIRMYERQLSRANQATQRLGKEPDAPR